MIYEFARLSPPLTFPSVPLNCPEFPELVDFIPPSSPQFGHRIGDSCPQFPWFPIGIGDSFGDKWAPVHPLCDSDPAYNGSIENLHSTRTSRGRWCVTNYFKKLAESSRKLSILLAVLDLGPAEVERIEIPRSSELRLF